jgi:hypothetical protein
MAKRSRQKQPLEISHMFEPHRCAQRLLREAYAQLLPETRRRLVAGHQSLSGSDGASTEGAERKRA